MYHNPGVCHSPRYKTIICIPPFKGNIIFKKKHLHSFYAKLPTNEHHIDHSTSHILHSDQATIGATIATGLMEGTTTRLAEITHRGVLRLDQFATIKAPCPRHWKRRSKRGDDDLFLELAFVPKMQWRFFGVET